MQRKKSLRKRKLRKTIEKITSNNYCELDGNSAERVANFLSDLTSNQKLKKSG